MPVSATRAATVGHGRARRASTTRVRDLPGRRGSARRSGVVSRQQRHHRVPDRGPTAANTIHSDCRQTVRVSGRTRPLSGKPPPNEVQSRSGYRLIVTSRSPYCTAERRREIDVRSMCNEKFFGRDAPCFYRSRELWILYRSIL